ncbi:similar to Saccharomyces cerevisiae YDR161W Putative protein of unknown function [Maudiozyma barnettii]|uniref:Assembly chaperone of RPL4 n=1 Tax=Maudiozyma barnettii TaxID=61262 RepID=A0A8H2VHB0_9SACH|nr:Acl4p [Kazachstania barnettii]CAB4255671.1 similar to Saccharomyces cerevisiae YDR161W Putative protein of unknown function [Kazachstania barnettii]CAD1784232.1 similar to Saccharomyces cerevisiae YDR161W Putative protein of unknown function [Kazachstania barnettii]
MTNLEETLKNVRVALSENDAKRALKLLKPFKKSLTSENSNNLNLKQVYAEAYLENGQLEKAYPILVSCCEIDPTGAIGGYDKFFTLGQIIGGKDGLNVMQKGIENVSSIKEMTQEHTNKIVSGLLSMIEIWMTDLCMEPNAESECEQLITNAMEISGESSPEAWLTLGSIRISQQRFKDATIAFTQAWKYFEIKKNEAGKAALDNGAPTHEEYAEMLQPLSSLAKMCMEVGLYDIALKVENAIKDIDEDNLEGYYLEGFTNYLICKVEIFKQQNPDIDLSPENIYEFNQHIQEIPLQLENEAIAEPLQEARVALSFANKLGDNVDSNDEVANELISGTKALLGEIGGVVSDEELQQLRKGVPVDGEIDEEIEIEYLSEEDGN